MAPRTRALTRSVSLASCAVVYLSLMACGGKGTLATSSGTDGSSGSVTPSANVLSAVVDAGPMGDSVNTLFTTVTICVPNTTTCQTIDHIQVDTGSFGLRLLAPVVTLALPLQASGSGTLAECVDFVDGYSWGPVALADAQIGGESANNLSVHLIGDSRYSSVPNDCSDSGTGTAENTVATFGANGILGIGVFVQDCGTFCVTPALPISGQHYPYYSCTATTCTQTGVPGVQQIPNPISLFASDNNGSFIQLPAVAASGAASVTGSLIFGIDTQSNNASGTQTVLTVDDESEFTVTFVGQSLTHSFLDSGSNGIYFPSSITTCTGNTQLEAFYCPSTTQNLSATLTGTNGVSGNASFIISNAQTLPTASSNFAALPGLGGTSPESDSFDFGLAFFYGRRVAAGLEGMTTAVATGPYVAF